MSMLTPPGMGGKYRITGNAYPRMRRPRGRRRLVVAMAALTAAGVFGWGTLELVDVFTGNHQAGAAEKPGCDRRKTTREADRAVRAAAPPLPDAGAIKVNVYNATPRSGLAKRAADELKKRGFKIGKVDNAPAEYDKKVTETAVLIGGPEAKPAFSVLGAHLAGTRTVEDRRKDATVDLVIGRAFKDFAPPKSAAEAITALTKPSPTPSAKHC